MARNSELIRQWEILRDIDGARNGVSIAMLANLRKVHQRTIRRDIQALCDAGFPLVDEKVNGSSLWKLVNRPFRGLDETGLSVMELCALYFGHTLLTTLAGVPFADDLERALGKLRRALPAASRKYLDAMPLLMKAKASGRKKQDARKAREFAARAADAALTHRRVTMRYASVKSARTKDYLVEPLRLSYAHGGVYLTAYVPAYQETRTFALERMQTLGVTDEHFEPRALPPEPFANSLGVNTGAPERIELVFDRSVAAFVTEREWHRSQEFTKKPDGSVVMTLLVCNDTPLRTWVLGFGAHARVVAPASLARDIANELERGAAQYGSLTAESRTDLRSVRPSQHVIKAEGEFFRLRRNPGGSAR